MREISRTALNHDMPLEARPYHISSDVLAGGFGSNVCWWCSECVWACAARGTYGWHVACPPRFKFEIYKMARDPQA